MSIHCPPGMAKTDTQWEQFKTGSAEQQIFSAGRRLREQIEWEQAVCAFHKMVAASECSFCH